MKIDKKTVLIKAHYFMFAGGMAPVTMFLMVMGIQLGASVAVMGSVDALILVMSTVLKPIMSMFADAFPKSRRPLLIGMVTVTCISLGFFGAIPPFKESPSFPSAFVAYGAPNATNWGFDSDSNSSSSNVEHELVYESLKMNFSQTCSDPDELTNSSELAYHPWSQLQVILPLNSTCELQSGRDCHYAEQDALLQLKLLNSSPPLGYTTYSVSAKEGARPACEDVAHPGSLECVGGKWNNSVCGGSLFSSSAFWYFVAILVVREIAYSTTNTFTDAITVDTVGTEGDFGSQRLWKILSRMLLAPVTSAFIDWYSGDAETKNYTPAFILASIFAALDIVVCFFMKVPETKTSEPIWNSTKQLLTKYQFVLFLFFTLMTGTLNAAPMVFLFVFQEELAAGTPIMKHMKLLQGLTIFVRGASQIPCSYYADRLVRKYGPGRLTTIIFGIHILRLVLLSAVGMWGPVWATLIVEVLDGPVYGLGYPLVVLYARQFTPPGLTNTVQSLANNAYDNICFALSSAITGHMISKLGSTSTFMIWAVVALVTGVLHALFEYFSLSEERNDPAARGDTNLQNLEGSTKADGKNEEP